MSAFPIPSFHDYDDGAGEHSRIHRVKNLNATAYDLHHV